MDTSLLNSITQWVHLHPHWAYFFIFFISFLESLALIGLIIPGTVFMTAAGILAGSQILPLGPVFLFATLGSFLGDCLSFVIGLYYRENLKTIWPFRSFPHVLEKGENFFHKHGGKSIFLGRFIGPIRPIIPLIAGSLKMSNGRFLAADFSGSILWAILYLLPGFIIGAASLALPADAAKRIIIDLVLLLIAIFICYWILQLCFVKIIAWLDKMVFRLWNFLQSHPRYHVLHNLLKISNIPEDHSQLGITIFALFFWIIFIILLISVITHSGIYHINIPLNHFFRSAYSLTLQKTMLGISYIATPKTFIIFWIIIFAWLCWRRFWFTAIHWGLVGLIAAGLSGGIKLLIASPRPTGLATTPSGFSFPSGHTTMATAIFSFLAIIIARDRDVYFGWFCYILAAILCVLVGLTRVYLGVHWTTDVLGGFALGLAISLSLAVSFRRYHKQQQRLLEFFLVIILSLSAIWIFNYHFFYKNDLRAFAPVWSKTQITETEWWQNGIPNSPLYRKNRLGKDVQTLNIEWLGTLSNIQSYLQQRGWQNNTKSILLHTISYFGQKDKNKALPLFSAIYQDKNPVLLMSKIIAVNNKLLILRLWHSNVVVTGQTNKNSLPLWVGNVSYIYIDKEKLFQKQKKLSTIKPYTPFALDILISDLNFGQVKTLSFSGTQPLKNIKDIGWDGRVLLIK